MTNPVDPMMNNAVNQTDYLKLFMQELTYQDPLKPIDNREFMAQMAQFSALQATQATNENLAALTFMVSATQTLMLLGKHVKIQGSNEEGIVNNVQFPAKSPPIISVMLNGSVQTKQLTDITQVWN